MRFISIFLGCCVCVLLCMGIIYYWGMGLVHPKYDHPFSAAPTPWIVLPHHEYKNLSPAFAANPQDQQWVAWIDVYRTASGTLVADSVNSTQSLVDLLPSFHNRRIILNIASNSEDIDRQLSEVLSPWLKSTFILLQSDYDIILRSTKAELANIPYGASQSDWLRFNAFASMAPWPNGLLPATPYHGDIYVSPLRWRKIPIVTANIVNELHRRQKSVILGPLQNEQDVQQAQSLGTDGFYFTHADLAESFFKARPAVAPESISH